MKVNVMVINEQISSAAEFYNHAKQCEALQTYVLDILCLERTTDGFRIRLDFSDVESDNHILYYSMPISYMLEGIQQLGSYYARLLDLKIPIPLENVKIYCYSDK